MVQIPRLREWRETRALTQVELAELADLSSRSVAGYEAGAGARPSTVRRLAEVLGVEVTDLRGDAEHPLGEAPSSQEKLFNGPMSAELPGLQTVRERRNMGVKELAARSGLPVSDIATLEDGGRLPNPIRIELLSDILGCMPGELMFPHEQYEAFLAEANNPEVVEEDLSKVNPETALAIRRVNELLVRGYRENDEQQAREQPEAG